MIISVPFHIPAGFPWFPWLLVTCEELSSGKHAVRSIVLYFALLYAALWGTLVYGAHTAVACKVEYGERVHHAKHEYFIAYEYCILKSSMYVEVQQ